MRINFLLLAFTWALCCLPLAGQLDSIVAQQIASGDAEISRGNYLKARAVYTAAAERLAGIADATLPQLHDIYYRRLESEVLIGDYATARQTSQGMLEKTSRTPELQSQVYFMQGRIAMELGDYGAAEGHFGRAMNAAGPLAGNIRAAYGELLRRRERYSDATREFAEAATLLQRLGKQPVREVQLGPVEMLVTLGKYAEAQREIDSLANSWKPPAGHPDTIHLRSLSGYVAMRLGDAAKAAKDLKGSAQTIEANAGPQNPGYATALLLEAMLAYTSGDDATAKTAFDNLANSLGSLPANPAIRSRIQLALGSYLLAKGETANARKHLLDAQKTRIALWSEDSIAAAEANVLVGLSELQLNQFGLAEGYLSRANTAFEARQVSVNQEYRLASDFGFGVILHQRKDYAGAKLRLARWLTNSKLRREWAGTGSKVRELMGEILLSESTFKEAVRELEQALDLESTVTRSGPAALARISLLLGRARFGNEDYPGVVSALDSLMGRADIRNSLAIPDQADAYRLLGNAYSRLRHPPEAASAFQSALKLYTGRIRTDDPIFMTTLQSAANALVDVKRFGEAIPLFVRLLAIRDQKLDPSSPESIAITSRLAELYYADGQFAQAAPLYERLIDATLKGKTVGDRKLLLERVGETYTKVGRIEDAVRAFDQRARLALDRHSYAEAEEFTMRIQKTLGSSAASAPLRAAALNILGDIRTAQGKPEEAEKLFREAVALGSGNQMIEASSLNGLGRLALKQKDYARARTELDRALTLITAMGSKDKRGLEAMAVANLAALNAVAGDQPAALELYARFLGLESQTTVDDPPLIEYLDEVANLYARVPAKAGEIEEIYRRRLKSSSRSFGDASPETAYAHYNLAEAYALRKEYPAALDQYHNALRIFESIKGPESDEAATALTGIATTQAKAGELDLALKTYASLLAIAEKSPADGPRKQNAVLNALALVYRQAGRHKEARETFQKCAALWSEKTASEPLWVAAVKNVSISYLDEGLVKEGTASFANLRLAVRKTAGNRDSLVEVDVLRTMGQGLKRVNRTKDSEEANRQADLAEKRLSSRK